MEKEREKEKERKKEKEKDYILWLIDLTLIIIDVIHVNI